VVAIQRQSLYLGKLQSLLSFIRCTFHQSLFLLASVIPKKQAQVYIFPITLSIVLSQHNIPYSRPLITGHFPQTAYVFGLLSSNIKHVKKWKQPCLSQCQLSFHLLIL
jgi:hypothetical protein